jgi:hypothetical protein
VDTKKTEPNTLSDREKGAFTYSKACIEENKRPRTMVKAKELTQPLYRPSNLR